MKNRSEDVDDGNLLEICSFLSDHYGDGGGYYDDYKALYPGLYDSSIEGTPQSLHDGEEQLSWQQPQSLLYTKPHSLWVRSISFPG